MPTIFFPVGATGQQSQSRTRQRPDPPVGLEKGRQPLDYYRREGLPHATQVSRFNRYKPD